LVIGVVWMTFGRPTMVGRFAYSIASPSLAIAGGELNVCLNIDEIDFE